jgi:hypothetical protein
LHSNGSTHPFCRLCPATVPYATTLPKTMTIPTLTYNSKTWSLTKKQRQKIEIAETKFLISVAEYMLEDQFRNTVIRNNLNIFSLNKIILNNKLN